MENKITVAAVGDIFLGRRVEDTIDRRGPNYIFDRVRPFLEGHDVVVGNLESPISSTEVTDVSEGLLIAKAASLDGLKEAGFNAVSLANNHIVDFGLSALQDTLGELGKRGIGTAGAGLNEADAWRPLRNIGGKSVTLLSYYGMGKGGNLRRAAHTLSSGAFGEVGGHNSGEISKVLTDIAQAREEADVVLVAVHWGLAAMDVPIKHQVELAHQMIDHGATAILGSGPHTLQPVERYNGGVVAYSLGNFVFDLRDREDQRHSMILDLSFVGGDLESVRIIPILIGSEYRPEPIDPSIRPDLYEYIESLLVDKLERASSDAEVLSHLRVRSLTPKNVLKKLVWREHGVYPLSFYARCVLSLVKERLSPKG